VQRLGPHGPDKVKNLGPTVAIADASSHFTCHCGFPSRRGPRLIGLNVSLVFLSKTSSWLQSLPRRHYSFGSVRSSRCTDSVPIKYINAPKMGDRKRTADYLWDFILMAGMVRFETWSFA
jgi:hypothetical protein